MENNLTFNELVSRFELIVVVVLHNALIICTGYGFKTYIAFISTPDLYEN
jgi:hypothetical protein